MISTKNLIRDVKSVPDLWIYNHYLKLDNYQGENICILSPFKQEKSPSFKLYFYENEAKDKQFIKWKCFATGRGPGTALNMVKEMFSLDYKDTCHKLVEDYNDYILHNNGEYDIGEFKKYGKYKVISYIKRNWTVSDSKYWLQFNISSDILKRYNVFPLQSYKMSKEENGIVQELEIQNVCMYGYFKDDGSLYCIYQPLVKEKKFLKVSNYLQGSEQLKQYKTLLICSSLKDIMSLQSLGLKIDAVAPNSETIILSQSTFDEYKLQYEYIGVMLDNDETGIKWMGKYKDEYDIPSILISLSKDISDSIRDFSPKIVGGLLITSINYLTRNNYYKEKNIIINPQLF